MAKKLFHVGIIMGLIVFLFVLFPQVLIPQIDDLPKPPSVMAEFIRFELPPGFSANVFASDLPGVRVLEEDPNGTLIVSLMKEGKIVAVTDTDGDGEAEEKTTIIEGLSNPHGLALMCGKRVDETCSLYVAETESITLYQYDPASRSATFTKKVVDLPSLGIHKTRTLLPDSSGEHIFVSVGSSCDFCQEIDRRYASVQSLDIETGALETYAKGLYNTVFMAINPVTDALWGTEMAPGEPADSFSPPDEINIIERGNDYGWPFCYGDNISPSDLELEEGFLIETCDEKIKTPSTIDLPPHAAPLGLAFIPSEGWPQEYANDLLVAYHGPASSSLGDGHRIIRIEMGPGGVPTGEVKPFMTGFTDAEGRLLGRPVDLLAQPDGTLLISGDLLGRIYRVSWKGGR